LKGGQAEANYHSAFAACSTSVPKSTPNLPERWSTNMWITLPKEYFQEAGLNMEEVFE
jgi:hypothetical protein